MILLLFSHCPGCSVCSIPTLSSPIRLLNMYEALDAWKGPQGLITALCSGDIICPEGSLDDCLISGFSRFPALACCLCHSGWQHSEIKWGKRMFLLSDSGRISPFHFKTKKLRVIYCTNTRHLQTCRLTLGWVELRNHSWLDCRLAKGHISRANTRSCG